MASIFHDIAAAPSAGLNYNAEVVARGRMTVGSVTGIKVLTGMTSGMTWVIIWDIFDRGPLHQSCRYIPSAGVLDWGG